MTPLSFIHISDSHIGPSKDSVVQGVKTFERTEKLVSHLNSLTFDFDFIIHTGDIISDPNPQATALAREIFSKLKKPIFYIPGNHDDAETIQSLMKLEQVSWIPSNDNRISYHFSRAGHSFVALDPKPEGQFFGARQSEESIAFIRELISKKVESLTIFVHYPVLPVGSEWIDKMMLLHNGTALHGALKTAAPGVVKGVFSGHIHRPFSVVNDGIIYSTAASIMRQFLTWPNQEKPQFEISPLPGFALVTLQKTGCAVSHHTFDE